MTKLTALITCFNEQDKLRPCLASVRWADEILVVDSFSTDGTVAIAREFTDRVLQHQYLSPARQKNWAIPQARHDWVLILDADEQVTPELAHEIRDLLAGDPPCEGYALRRRNFFLGREIRHSGWQNDWVMRLLRREAGRYDDVAVHETLRVPGPTGRCRNPLIHYPYRTLDEQFTRLLRYSRWGAEEGRRRGRRMTYLRMLLHPWLRFLRGYLLRGGILDGLHGLVVCLFAAFGVMARDARLWELNSRAAAEGDAEKPTDS